MDEQPDEEVHIGRGPQRSQVRELLSPWSWEVPPSWHRDVCSPTWEPFEPHTSGFFMAAPSHRQDRLLTAFPITIQEKGERG